MNHTYAWCFSHGRLHDFHGEPWCTADWVAFVAPSEEGAHEAKIAAYGDARFLNGLPVAQQIEVLEIVEGRS